MGMRIVRSVHTNLNESSNVEDDSILQYETEWTIRWKSGMDMILAYNAIGLEGRFNIEVRQNVPNHSEISCRRTFVKVTPGDPAVEV